MTEQVCTCVGCPDFLGLSIKAWAVLGVLSAVPLLLLMVILVIWRPR